MKDVFSAVIRISRFRHGEGGAERSDALISMADIVPSAPCPNPSFSPGRSPWLNFKI